MFLSNLGSRDILPAVPPPLGQTYDPNAPNTLYQWNILCEAVSLTVTAILVWLRLYTKARIVKKFGLEDWSCLIAWLLLVVYSTIVSVVGFDYGSGRHIWDLSQETLVRNLMLNNILEIIYGPLKVFTTASLLLFYSALLTSRRGGKLWWTAHSLLLFITLFYTAITIIKIFECTPRSRIWNKKQPGKCINLGQLLIVTGTFNLVLDLCVLVLPLFKVWNLKLRRRQQISISAVFTLGVLAPIATAFRLVESIRASKTTDTTYTFYNLVLWTVAEIATGIVCSSLLIMPAFVRATSAWLKTSSTGFSKSTSNSQNQAAGRLDNAMRQKSRTVASGYWELDEHGINRKLSDSTQTVTRGHAALLEAQSEPSASFEMCQFESEMNPSNPNDKQVVEESRI